MDMIHEEGDFECGMDSGMDGKPVQLFQCIQCDRSLGLRSFIRRAAVCRTEDKGCSVDEGRP